MTSRSLKLSISIALVLFLPNIASPHGQHKPLGERIKLSALSSYKIGPYQSGAAQDASFDAATQRAFVTNSHAKSVDAISLSQPKSPIFDFRIDLKDYGSINSVAVKNAFVAIAVGAKNPQESGKILLYDTQGNFLNSFKTGAMPDMVVFSPNGRHILSANEGAPNQSYDSDPEGSITIIDMRLKPDGSIQKAMVRTADFKAFHHGNIDPAIRIFGKNATVAADLEPEYITISSDSKTAWVSLQENNAIAELSIEHGRVKKIFALGYQDHSRVVNAIDVSDKDGDITIQPWPISGLYQPDAIASYEIDGETFIVTANEGDERDYEGFSEVQRVADLALEPELKKVVAQNNDELGRLKVSTVNADTDHNGLVDVLYSFGSRSFSIWNQDLVQVFDSGSQFERITGRDYPTLFNHKDTQSDEKGPEPEALVLGQVGESTYAFIGLESTGGIMVYNITVPEKAFFVDYLNTISPSLKPSDPQAGDIGPENLIFVNSSDSPSGQPFIISANEVSGTLSIYQIDRATPKDR